MPNGLRLWSVYEKFDGTGPVAFSVPVRKTASGRYKAEERSPLAFGCRTYFEADEFPLTEAGAWDAFLTRQRQFLVNIAEDIETAEANVQIALSKLGRKK